MILGKFESVLIVFLIISIAFNFVLAYKIDKIKEEVLINCNEQLTYALEKAGCRLPPIDQKAVYVNIDDIITELPK